MSSSKPLYHEDTSVNLPGGTRVKILKRSDGSIGWKYKVQFPDNTTKWLTEAELGARKVGAPSAGAGAGRGGIA